MLKVRENSYFLIVNIGMQYKFYLKQILDIEK